MHEGTTTRQHDGTKERGNDGTTARRHGGTKVDEKTGKGEREKRRIRELSRDMAWRVSSWLIIDDYCKAFDSDYVTDQQNESRVATALW